MSRRSGRVRRRRSRGRRARRDASGAPVSRRVREPENLRGDCTQISRCRDRVTRCDGAYLGADAEGDAALGGGLRGELAVGDGSAEAGRGGQRCAGGGRIRERHRAEKDLSTGAVAIPRCRCHRPENDAPDAIDGRSPGDRGAGGKLGSGGDESGHCCCCYVYDERVYRVLVCREGWMRARFSSSSSSNERAVLGRLFARRPLIGCCRNSDILALGFEAKRAPRGPIPSIIFPRFGTPGKTSTRPRIYSLGESDADDLDFPSTVREHAGSTTRARCRINCSGARVPTSGAGCRVDEGARRAWARRIGARARR